MESPSNSEQTGASVFTRPEDEEASSLRSSKPRWIQGESSDLTSRSLGAMEWQTGRPVNSSDRPAPDSLPQPVSSPEATRQIERITSLVVRESALVRQHGRDSMAVVLRPDAETELFVHLTHRDGRIEASVRCERGDFHQLNALWPQLQEALAGQKIRLTPLTDAAGPPPSDLTPSAPSLAQDSSGGQSSWRSPRHPDESLTEPAPLAPTLRSVTPQLERPRSAHRLTPSRPGWETWA